MKPMILSRLCCVALLIAVSGRAAQAETFVGTNVDSRIMAGFKVRPEGVQPFLPAGWSPVPFPGGPLKGVNLIMVLIDRAVQLDPEGKLTPPPNSRNAVFIGLGKQDGGDAARLYVYRVYTTYPDADPYGNAVEADVSRTASVSGPANAGRLSKEVWTVQPEGGGELNFALSYTTGQRSWSHSEANSYSNAIPDFRRIYRYDQLVDVAMSVPMGKPLAGDFNFASTVPELAAIFDGSHEALAILDVPVYVREVYLP